MSYAAIARFDEEANDAFLAHKRALESLLAHDDAASWPPHLTLGCYDGDIEAQLCAWGGKYAAICRPFHVQFNAVGMFMVEDKAAQDTCTIFAVPSQPPKLTCFYYGFHAKLEQYCWPHYKASGFPLLHSTLSICPKDEYKLAMDYLLSAFVPMEARVEQICIHEIPSGKLLGTYPMTGKALYNG